MTDASRACCCCRYQPETIKNIGTVMVAQSWWLPDRDLAGLK